MRSADIEAIERATIAAVAPEALEEIPGWLLPFDSGTVGRAKSAAPTSHAPPDPASLERIAAAYEARNLPAMLRVPETAAFRPFCEQLAAGGYRRDRPTQVHVAATSAVRRVCSDTPAEIASRPDEGWALVFLGEGFDPADGASRVKTLSRAASSMFASVREDGQTVAAGAVAFGHGWASVHGMRTAQRYRGRGLAGRILAALAQEALSRGHERMFLQVEADNASAQALYRRAGFELGWNYAYWRKDTDAPGSKSGAGSSSPA